MRPATNAAADFVSRRLTSAGLQGPRVGLILGSGLGAAADRVLSDGGIQIPFVDIPGLPQSRVAGHAGRLIAGRVGSQAVAILQGRVHLYEGHSIQAILAGVRLLIGLGIERLIITNAAGGIRAGFKPGDLMLIRDHIRWPSFGALSDAVEPFSRQQRSCWSSSMRKLAARDLTPLAIHEGVYAMMPGPNYETPAEIRMLRSLGADAVGMSTVPEALCATQAGIDVLGVSCITNVAAGLSEQTLSHADVTATASQIEHHFADWILRVVEALGGASTRGTLRGEL